MKTIIMVLLAFFVCQSCIAQSKTEEEKVTVASKITIHSKILNEDRTIYIYAPSPQGGPYDGTQPLHVLYLMDGDAHTAFVASQVDYASNRYNVLPPMLVVGIANYSYDRFRDLTPIHTLRNFNGSVDTSVKSRFKTTGGGENFLRFIKEELMPYVESHYKTAPYKIFSGHSLGGIMSLYCMAVHPEMFNAYIAVSPSIWIDDRLVLNQLAKTADEGHLKNKTFFFSDANESRRFHNDVLSLDSLLKAKNTSGFSYKYVPYPDETHGSEPLKAEYEALRFIYPQLLPGQTDSTAAQIKAFYSQLSNKYGYTILPRENDVNGLAYRYLDDPSKINEAISLFELNAENYPASYNSYDSLGDASAKKGDKKKAIELYKKALTINPGSDETKKKLSALEK